MVLGLIDWHVGRLIVSHRFSHVSVLVSLLFVFMWFSNIFVQWSWTDDGIGLSTNRYLRTKRVTRIDPDGRFRPSNNVLEQPLFVRPV